MRDFVLKAANRKQAEDSNNHYRRNESFDDVGPWCETASSDGRAKLHVVPARDRLVSTNLNEESESELVFEVYDMDCGREHLYHNSDGEFQGEPYGVQRISES